MKMHGIQNFTALFVKLIAYLINVDNSLLESFVESNVTLRYFGLCIIFWRARVPLSTPRKDILTEARELEKFLNSK